MNPIASKIFGLFGAGIALHLASPSLCAAAEKPTPPNIIVVLADDLGYGDLGCYGQQEIRTPNLDRMAKDGMRFTNAYSGSTVCAPSRCVLMTGRHTGQATVRGNVQPGMSPACQSLSQSDVTIARVLKQAGYVTANIGKWGLGEPGAAAEGMPLKQGFDYFYGYLNQHHAHNSWPSFLWRNECKVPTRNVVPNEDERGAGVASKRVDFAQDLFIADAQRFIRENRSSPFFLYLALTAPHANNEAEPMGIEVPDTADYADKPWPEVQRSFASLVSRLDKDVGKILATLRELSLEKNTLVLFLSDNGPHAEGGANPAFFKSSGPLKGHKRSMYEGGIRVPMIAWGPGMIPAGRTEDTPCFFGDFLPSFADLANAPAPKGINGVSLRPLLSGRPQPELHERPLFWDYYENGYMQAARKGPWKAVRPSLEAPLELYYLPEDQGEIRDRAKDQPALVAEFEAFLIKERTHSPYWPVVRDRYTEKLFSK